MATQHTVTLDTPIVIKISVNGQLKKLKLPMKDLGVSVLPDKVCEIRRNASELGKTMSTLQHNCPTLAIRIPQFTSFES
jgi:hypothetical protein